jgi:hypothetical protein
MMSVVYRPDHPDANENGMVDISIAPAKYPIFGTAPNVISDNLGTHLRHMGTGRYLDSKSAFAKEDKACGATCVGNDSSVMGTKPRKYVEAPRPGPDIKRAIEQLKSQS